MRPTPSAIQKARVCVKVNRHIRPFSSLAEKGSQSSEFVCGCGHHKNFTGPANLFSFLSMRQPTTKEQGNRSSLFFPSPLSLPSPVVQKHIGDALKISKEPCFVLNDPPDVGLVYAIFGGLTLHKPKQEDAFPF